MSRRVRSRPARPGQTHRATRGSALYVFAVLLGAGLLFLIQPMSSKMVLPRFGGAPAVWSTCMVFYQALLLAGYAYAHLLSRHVSPRWQVPLHGLVMLVPLASLPIGAAEGEAPGGAHPIPGLLALLSISFGLPYLMVSTTSPLLQAWFSRTPAAEDPYPLYAASNLGSLLGLLAYPLLLEPSLPLRMHGLIWSAGYAILTGLVLACGARLWRVGASRPAPLSDSTPSPIAPSPAADEVTSVARLHWLALAFAPSSLMLSVTLHLTTDVAAIPLLWVIPLALYLLTFVLAFSRRQLLPLSAAARVMPLFVLMAALVLISEATQPVCLLLIAHLAAFFVVALVCHGELARRRPPPQRLTEFYLFLSLGGILGGTFSALVAPFLFRSVAEYPLVLLLACALRPAPEAAGEAERREEELRQPGAGCRSFTQGCSIGFFPPCWAC